MTFVPFISCPECGYRMEANVDRCGMCRVLDEREASFRLGWQARDGIGPMSPGVDADYAVHLFRKSVLEQVRKTKKGWFVNEV